MVDCIDLVEYVSPEQSFCLNEAKDHTHRGCLLAEQRCSRWVVREVGDCRRESESARTAAVISQRQQQ